MGYGKRVKRKIELQSEKWEEWSWCAGKGKGAKDWKDVKPAEVVRVCIAAFQEARARVLLNRLQAQCRAEICAAAGDEKGCQGAMCSSPLGERWGRDCTGKGRGGILPACEIVVFPVTLIIGSGWDFLLTSGWQVGFCCSRHPGAILVSEGHQSIFPWDFLWALKERVVVACDDSRRHRSFLGGVLVCCWVFLLFCFVLLFFILLHFLCGGYLRWSLHSGPCAAGRAVVGESGAVPGLQRLCGEWTGNFISALLSSWFTGIWETQTPNLWGFFCL